MKKEVILILLILFISSCAQKEMEEAPEPEVVELPFEAPEETVPEEIEPVIEEIIEPETVVETLEETPSEPNLIAHWKFDDDAKDSANDNDGTIKGGASFAAGKLGKALSFDGVDDYVDFSQSTIDEMGSLTKGTIAFWFKFSSLLDTQVIMPIFYFGMESGSDNMYIIELGHAAGTEGGYDPNVAIGTPDPGNKMIYATWVKNNNQNPFLCFDSNKDLDEDKWYHYAVVVGADGNTGYLDGVEMADRDYNFGNANDKSFLSSIPVKKKFTLGYGKSSSGISPDFSYFKGALDDVRIYDKTLSADEVKGLSS